MEVDEFEKLVGQEFAFYGVDGTAFKLGDKVWKATEDDSDGYRSYLSSLLVTDPRGLIFFGSPIATVRVEDTTQPDTGGFQLVDIADGHVWLRVGTDYHDDYYPCFMFTYTPRKQEETPNGN